MKEVDVLIIGAGPAGIQAAIHASRRKAKVVVVGRTGKSNLEWAKIENLFCILGQASGSEMLKRGKEQAERFGAKFLETDAVSLSKGEGSFSCTVEEGETITSKALIISTGVTRSRRKLLKGEKDFLGRGVSYCADCDAPFYRGKRVVVVGGESAAFAAAQTLAQYASEVIVIDPKGEMKPKRRSELLSQGKVALLDKKPTGIEGGSLVERIRFGDGEALEIEGVFIEQGSRGLLELAMPLGIMPNEKGFIAVDREQRTEVEGVYACGDVTGPPFQVCKAIGEGCVAALSAVDDLRRV